MDTKKTQEKPVVTTARKTRAIKQNTVKKTNTARTAKKVVTKATAENKTHKTKFTLKAVGQALMETRGCKYKAAQLLGCSRVTLDTYINKSSKLREIHSDMIEGQIDEIEDKAFGMAIAGNAGIIKFMLSNLGKNRGYYEAKPEAVRREVDKTVREIVAKLQEGEISASYAALEFTGLGLEVPDSVRLLLQKEVVETPDLTNGEFSPITEQEMMERVNRRKDEVGEQVDNLSQREAEIRELKEEMKNTDSFDPNNTMESGNGKTT